MDIDLLLLNRYRFDHQRLAVDVLCCVVLWQGLQADGQLRDACMDGMCLPYQQMIAATPSLSTRMLYLSGQLTLLLLCDFFVAELC
jgi:hypothetical protein